MGMDIFSIARSGMDLATRQLEASADNVANAETEGYQAKRVEAQQAPGGGVQSAVESTGAPTDIATELVNQIVLSTTYKANAQVVRAEGDITGALVDIKA